MSEIRDLLGIYGAIDDAAQRDYTEIAPRLAPLFAVYREHPIDAVENGGWFKAFIDWGDRVHAVADPPVEATEFPSYREALLSMADRPPAPRAMARRMLAVTALMRTIEDLRPGGEVADLVASALFAREGLVPSMDAAQQLQSLLYDKFVDMDTWTAMLDEAIGSELIDTEMQAQLHAPPCIGDVTTKPNPNDPTDLMPVTVLETSFTVPIDFEAALTYLNPLNWPACSNFWCRVEEQQVISPTQRIYFEEVGIDCSDPAYRVSTLLKFTFARRQTEAYCSYKLPPGHPLPGAAIEFDGGFLRIVKQPNGEIRVTTSKHVKFSGSLNGAYLGMFMCPTGYASAVEDALFNCAKLTGSPGAHPYPVEAGADPNWHVPSGRRAPAGGRTGGQTQSSTVDPQDPPGGSPLGKALQDVADAAQACLQEQAASYQNVASTMATGSYGIDDYVAGMAQMWNRGLQDLPLLSSLARAVIGSLPSLYSPTRSPDYDPER